MLEAFPYTYEPTHKFLPDKRNASGYKELGEKQYKSSVQVFKKLDSNIKLICVCGNHDIGNKDTLKIYESNVVRIIIFFGSVG